MAEVKKQKTEEKLIITDEFIAKHKENPNVQVQMEKSKVSYIVKSFNSQGFYHHFKMVQNFDPVTRVASDPEPVVALGKGQDFYLKFPISASFCKELGEHLLKVAEAMHGLEYIPPAREKQTSEHDDMVLDFIKRNAKPSLGDLKESSA